MATEITQAQLDEAWKMVQAAPQRRQQIRDEVRALVEQFNLIQAEEGQALELIRRAGLGS